MRIGSAKDRVVPPAIQTRRAVLRALTACERGLARAYAVFQATLRPPVAHAPIVARGLALHRAHVRWLTDAVRAVGAEPPELPDDLWVQGPPRDLRTLMLAERAAHDTLHDALASFEQPFAIALEKHVI